MWVVTSSSQSLSTASDYAPPNIAIQCTEQPTSARRSDLQRQAFLFPVTTEIPMGTWSIVLMQYPCLWPVSSGIPPRFTLNQVPKNYETSSSNASNQRCASHSSLPPANVHGRLLNRNASSCLVCCTCVPVLRICEGSSSNANNQKRVSQRDLPTPGLYA
nr:hypothetical protein [Tanacetum cinerariifolium]